MTPRLPIFTFHAIDERRSPITIDRTRFAETIAALAGAGWRSLTLDQLLDGHARGRWPDRSLLLTFDDAFASAADVAWPVLRQHGFTAIVFVVAGFAGRLNDWPGQPAWAPRLPLLDWPALGQLAREGCAIGSHTMTHPALPALAPEARAAEIIGAKQTIEDRLGLAVESFAYPYGSSSAEIRATVAAHYKAAFGTDLRFATGTSPLHELERLDAFYVTPAIARALDRWTSRAYLEVRRRLRGIRGSGQRAAMRYNA
jgi:peptidoglycan/xylan/chitin deacetylase (PgdA/CDA1 family)